MISRNKRKTKEIDYVWCVWSLLCSMSSIDQEKNNISLFNVIQQFNIPSDFFIQQKKEKKNLLFPYAFEIVSLWKRTIDIAISDEEILVDTKLKTIDPNGNVLQETFGTLNFKRGIKILRFRFIMPGIIATIPGSYAIQIDIKLPNQKDFKTVKEVPFEITEAQVPGRIS